MREFTLEILTPERFFYQDPAESFVCSLEDGEICILAGHQPMIAVLPSGNIRINTKGKCIEAIHSGGFIEVRPDKVVAFLETCETPEEYGKTKAEQKRRHELEKERHSGSLSEQRQNRISVTRAIHGLKDKGKIE